MKYIYILGLILLILICILYNHKIKEGLGFSPEDSNFEKNKIPILNSLFKRGKNVNSNELGNVVFNLKGELEEKSPSDYQIKQRRCNELKICDQLDKPEYNECGYCLADEMDITKPYKFHYGNKGGANDPNSNCYHSKPKYTEYEGNLKRNAEWVVPKKYKSSETVGKGSLDKCKEIKTKYICEKQSQCNFMTGKEENIDKEVNCGWCLDEESDVGGTSYVRNLSTEKNDLRDIQANFVERLKKPHMMCTPKTYHKGMYGERTVWSEGSGGYNLMMSQCENLDEDSCKKSRMAWRHLPNHVLYDARICEWKVIDDVENGGIKKHYYCSNNTERNEGEIEKDDFLSGDYPDNTKCKSSQIEKEEWKTIQFPEFEAKHGKKCGKDLIKNSDCSIFLKESCMKKFYNKNTGEMEEPFKTNKDKCIRDLWVDIGFTNFDNFKDGFYVPEKGEKIKDSEIEKYMRKWRNADNFGKIQNSMVQMAKEKLHSKDFDTAKKWNKILLDKNVCKDAFDTDESEIAPNKNTDCVNPCYQYQLTGTEWENTPRECQVKIFERNGGRENGLVHPINKSGKMPSVLQFFEGFNINEGFTTQDISKVSIISTKKDNTNELISLNDESLKKRTIEQVSSIYEKIKKNINSEDFEKKYKAHLQLIGEAPSELENKLCWVEFVKIMRTYPGTKIGNTYQDITINNKMKNKLGNIDIKCYTDVKYCNKIIEAYLKIVKGKTNNWILKKKTYEDPGFDFRPWNKVVNDYWKEKSNWKKFMYLMMKQDHVNLHISDIDNEENKEKIEISEKSPFYNLINSETCTYSQNMFLLEFNVTNLGSGATLYIKNDNHQQKEELSMGENEILLHPQLYGTNIELIPLVKSSLNIENTKLIRIKDKKYTHNLRTYKKTSKCDNVWNYCYWMSGISLHDSFVGTETNLKMKYLLRHHRTLIDFTKFFGLISNDYFIYLRDYTTSDAGIIERTKGKENLPERKDTKFELDITARDQNRGWRTSRIGLEGGKDSAIIGIGGPYVQSSGHGTFYNKKNGNVNNNKTEIKKDVTNHVVDQTNEESIGTMKLKHYTTPNGSHETHIDNAKLIITNTPDDENNDEIDLLENIPGNKIKIDGNSQRKRQIPKELKWITISDGVSTYDDGYFYQLDGIGADQGWGWSTSRIWGSQMENPKGKNKLFKWRNTGSKKDRSIDKRWEDINLTGQINQHNTDDKLKIQQFTSQNGGHTSQLRDLNLKVFGGDGKISNEIGINQNYSINGTNSKTAGLSEYTTIFESFQNKKNNSIENNIINNLKKIKNYLFPEKEGLFIWPHMIWTHHLLIQSTLAKAKAEKEANVHYVGKSKRIKNQGTGKACVVEGIKNGSKYTAYGNCL